MKRPDKCAPHALRKGFTIVELLVVIGVLSVLVTIVTGAASSSFRTARDTRSTAIRTALQNGIASYRVQLGRYPGSKLQDWSENGVSGKNSVDYLDDSQYDTLMNDLATKTLKGSNARPLMDFMPMVVVPAGSAGNKKVFGREFKEAIKANQRHGSTLKLASMVFGYSETDYGYFRRFIVQYNSEADFVRVLRQNDYSALTGRVWPQKP